MMIILLILMTLLGAVAAGFLKKASSSTSNFFMLLKNKYFIFGGFIYLIAAILNIYILKFLDYSVVLPLTSVTYIWTMFISTIFFKEKVNIMKFSGIFLIILGSSIMVFRF